MFAIGNEELTMENPLGDIIICERCGEEHPVLYGEKILPDGRKVPSKTLAYVNCRGDQYLVGIDGKKI